MRKKPMQNGRQHLWHPYTRFSTLDAEPLPVIVGADGIHLVDAAGHRYVDAIASWWSCALGHGHPRIVRAIQQQAAILQHSILGNLSHPNAIELADRLAALLPTPDRHVLFASDGACAVEAALKIALQYEHNVGEGGRRRLAHLAGAYHGDTLGAISVGFLESFHKPFEEVLSPAIQLPVPYRAEQEEGVHEDILRIFEQHGHELAAVVVEPLCQGAAGMKMYSAKHLCWLWELCRERGVLLIIDEIATGFGRTGTMFAFEQADIDPDIVCVGKALSAGALPISATIVKDEIYQTFSDQPVDHTFYHGHTFSGNPIAAAAAIEALRLYGELDIAGKARAMGVIFHRELDPLRNAASVRDVRILGAIAAVELAGREQAVAVRNHLLSKGILLRPLGTVVYLMPPLIMEESALVNVARSLREAVEAQGG